jgi:hypothetical protein
MFSKKWEIKAKIYGHTMTTNTVIVLPPLDHSPIYEADCRSTDQKNSPCWNITVSQGGEKEDVVFWDVPPCSLVEVHRHFRGACCLHQQGDE